MFWSKRKCRHLKTSPWSPGNNMFSIFLMKIMKSFINNENNTRKLSQQMHSFFKKSLKTKQFYYIHYVYLLYTKYHNFQSETQNTLTSIRFHVLKWNLYFFFFYCNILAAFLFKLTVFNKFAFNSPSLYFTCDFSVVALC